MATNFFKIKKGLNLEPTSSPTLDQDGDIAYDSATNKIKARINGTTEDLALSSEVGSFATQELDNLGTTAINADLNPDASATRSLGASNYWLNVLGQFFIVPNGVSGRFGTPNRTGSDNSTDATFRSGTTVNGNSGDAYVGAGAVSGSGLRGFLSLLGRFVIFPSASADPTTPSTAALYYNTAVGYFKYYTGSAWSSFLNWATLNDLTAETAPATDDIVLLGDTSATASRKMTLANLWKVINSFTTETSIDQANDVLAVYDNSAAAIRKATVNSLLGGATAYANAGMSGNQNIATGTYTKMAIDTSYDSSNVTLDGVNYRLTPTVAGLYLVMGRAWKYDSTDTAQVGLQLRKNGTNLSEDWEWEAQSGTKDTTASTFAIVTMNGSSDYIELWAFQDTGITRTFQGANSATNLYLVRIR